MCVAVSIKNFVEKFHMDAPMDIEFVIVDETINRYGYRILVDGIDTEGFMKNPVACLQHNTHDVSVGRWKNIRKENGRLIGTLEFDDEDETAIKLYKKYKRGYMNAVSVAIIPIEESEDPEYLLPGQKYPTVTRCELLEISLVTVPGQKNAVRLVKPDGTAYNLNLISKSKHKAMNEKTTEQLQQELQRLRVTNAENLIKLHVLRGVVQEGEKESLQSLALHDYETVARMLEARKVTDNGYNQQQLLAKQLVALHAERLGLTASEVTLCELAATADYQTTRKILESRKGVNELNAFIGDIKNTASASNGNRQSWSYLDWYKNDLQGLLQMAQNNPDQFKRLEAEFLADSQKQGLTITPTV